MEIGRGNQRKRLCLHGPFENRGMERRRLRRELDQLMPHRMVLLKYNIYFVMDVRLKSLELNCFYVSSSPLLLLVVCLGSLLLQWMILFVHIYVLDNAVCECLARNTFNVRVLNMNISSSASSF